jgi:hypothetical protein
MVVEGWEPTVLPFKNSKMNLNIEREYAMI